MTSLQEPPSAEETAEEAEVAGLSESASGRPVPTAWERTRSRVRALDDRITAWPAAIALTLMAFGMRLYRLGSPDRFAFDETYYAKDAWGLLNEGYVRNYQEKPGGKEINDAIMSGQTEGIWTDGPSMEVHPEAGKWMIAVGEHFFGMDPFGWRISAAVVGSLMVLVICRLARRLTGSTMLGLMAGVLLAFDGLQFTLSRLALLDIFLAFWLLCGVAAVVNDRDWYRRRMARLLDDRPVDDGSGTTSLDPGAGWGPVRGLLFRPWLLTAGVCFGLAIGTKWTAIVPLGAFGLLTWLWSAGTRRSFGVSWATARSAVVDGVPAFLQLVMVAFLVYVATWTGWLIHADEYEKALSSTQYTGFYEERPCIVDADGNRQTDNLSDDDARWPTATEPDASGLGEVWQSLRSLKSYHEDVYTFHSHYLNCSNHVYQSQPSGWLLLNRPVGAATDLDVRPNDRCTDDDNSGCYYRQVLLIGTPVLWWGGALALAAAAVLWVGARDWRFGVAVTGTLTTWLPWLRYDDRPIFFFYAIACLPFLVLAVTLVLGKLIGHSRRPGGRRTIGVVVAGSFVVLVIVNFAYFYPILSYEEIARSSWIHRMWFTRWI